MPTLYNVTISGLQPETSNHPDKVIEEFSRHFNNRTAKLVDLLNTPRELCFFANISHQQAQDLQRTLSQFGLLCLYRPSNQTSEHKLSLTPKEESTICCPFCSKQQKKPDKLKFHRCISCGAKVRLFERRRQSRSHLRHQHFNCQSTLELSTLENYQNSATATSTIERAEVVTRESRRTRSLYRNILGFTIISIMAILILAIWQPSGLSSKHDKSSISLSATTVTIPITTKPAEKTDFTVKKQLTTKLPNLSTKLPPLSLIQLVGNQPLAEKISTKKDQPLPQLMTKRNETILRLVQDFHPETLLNNSNPANHSDQIDKILNSANLTSQLKSLTKSKKDLFSSAPAELNNSIEQITQPELEALALQLLNGEDFSPALSQLSEISSQRNKAILRLAQDLRKETILNKTELAIQVPQLDKFIQSLDLPPKLKTSISSTQDNKKNVTQEKTWNSLSNRIEQSISDRFLTKQLMQSATVKKMLNKATRTESNMTANDLIRKVYAMDALYRARQSLKQKAGEKKLSSNLNGKINKEVTDFNASTTEVNMLHNTAVNSLSRSKQDKPISLIPAFSLSLGLNLKKDEIKNIPLVFTLGFNAGMFKYIW